MRNAIRTQPLPQSMMGPYLLADRIGKGGMASVHKARREGADLQRPVVIKRLLPEYANDPKVIDMFRTEARTLALLNHSNIVQFLEFGLVDGVPYIVMEYLDGHDVGWLLRRTMQLGRRLPVGATLAIVDQVCQGLAWAHELVADSGLKRQIIHRDISPANIMACHDGSVKLLDFGIAKITRASTRAVTALEGKYGYISPEQVLGKPIDRRVDVFATGVVLHEMLTSRRLFRAASWLETLREHAHGRIPAPSESNPAVPPELDRVVLKALAINPDERYRSAAELADALEDVQIKRYSHRQLSAFLAGLRSDDGDWSDSDAVEETVTHAGYESFELSYDPSHPPEVEVIASVKSLPALSMQDAEMAPVPRPPAIGARAATIFATATILCLCAALVEVATRASPAPTAPVVKYVTLPGPPVLVSAPTAAVTPPIVFPPVRVMRRTPRAPTKSHVGLTPLSSDPPSADEPAAIDETRSDPPLDSAEAAEDLDQE